MTKARKTPLPRDGLKAYFRGIDFALAALEKRIQAMNSPTKEDVLKEFDRYHKMVKEYREALESG